jgi:hypothetical protein
VEMTRARVSTGKPLLRRGGGGGGERRSGELSQLVNDLGHVNVTTVLVLVTSHNREEIHVNFITKDRLRLIFDVANWGHAALSARSIVNSHHNRPPSCPGHFLSYLKSCQRTNSLGEICKHLVDFDEHVFNYLPSMSLLYLILRRLPIFRLAFPTTCSPKLERPALVDISSSELVSR